MTKPEVEIWFELETRCNLQCKFCFNYWKDGSSSAPRRLSTDLTLEALARLFAVVNCTKMSISGGEPLIREDLPEILSFIRNHAVPMVLTTNSTLLTERKVHELQDLGIATFQVPLHSVANELHDYLSGGKCWEHSIRSLIGLRSCGANVVPVFVGTWMNLRDFPNVVGLCGLLGLGEIIFNRFVPTGLGIIHRDIIGVPDDKALVKVLLQANAVAERFNMTIHLGMPVDVAPEFRESLDHVTLGSCPISSRQSRFTIDASGNVRRCNQSGASIGNLFSGGADLLERCLLRREGADPSIDDYKPCQILKGNDLVQLTLA